MKIVDSVSGTDLLGMLTAATDWLEQHAHYIDSLNVFPVPDGDTGTNMLLSMRAALAEARTVSELTASSVAKAFSRGALIGARGNSGIILSQFWQGLAQGIGEKPSITSADLVESLQRAAILSVQALSKPVHGTILTVIEDITAAAGRSTVVEEDIPSFIEILVEEAGKSVARTQSQLQVLREAGVVDAGGEGLHIVLEGALTYFRGQGTTIRRSRSPLTVTASQSSAPKTGGNEESYGFCTEFILRGENLKPAEIRSAFEDHGQSLVVAGNGNTIRVHIHTPNPDSIMQHAKSFGQIEQLSIRDMDEQYRVYRANIIEETGRNAARLLALVPGQGFAEILGSLGAETMVIDTQEPTEVVRELLDAIERPESSRVFILPNNIDLLPIIEESTKSRRGTVRVVAAKTIPEGISAVLAYNPTEDYDSNRRLMERAVKAVHSVELMRQDRNRDRVDGLLDGRCVAQGENAEIVLEEIMAGLHIDNADVATVYCGRGIGAEAVQAVCSKIRLGYPHLEITTISAGSFGSDFIISIE